MRYIRKCVANEMTPHDIGHEAHRWLSEMSGYDTPPSLVRAIAQVADDMSGRVEEGHKHDICPNCGQERAGALYREKSSVLEDEILERVYCDQCGTYWTQVYKFAGFRHIQKER